MQCVRTRCTVCSSMREGCDDGTPHGVESGRGNSNSELCVKAPYRERKRARRPRPPSERGVRLPRENAQAALAVVVVDSIRVRSGKVGAHVRGEPLECGGNIEARVE